jgi:hypothetical protein
VQGKVGILHQARLDIMRPSDDPQQSRISQCLVFGVLHQHLHFRGRHDAAVLSPSALGLKATTASSSAKRLCVSFSVNG